MASLVTSNEFKQLKNKIKHKHNIYVNISYTYKNQIKTNYKKSLKNQNPLSEEGQTIQWAKEKRQKKKPGSTKHYTET